MPTAREIVDYAEQDNAIEMRNALYGALHDKIMDHINNHKVEVAKQLMNPPAATAEDEVIYAANATEFANATAEAE